jgi:hypothetical protein
MALAQRADRSDWVADGWRVELIFLPLAVALLQLAALP